MKLAVIVTDFPKVTETFVLRDLMYFNKQGHEIRVYHINRFRRGETIHEFARPTLGWARYVPFLFSARVWGAVAKTRPGALWRVLSDLFVRLWKHPVVLVKSLVLVPKAIAIGDELASWKADHVHAEFAGHPATCAWIAHRCRGLPYSVSCHAHGIFRNQALLDVTLGEASAVRSISEYNRQFLKERIQPLEKKEIDVIHVGLDFSEFPYVERPRNDGSFRILYVGSLTAKKGVRHLLRSLEHVPGDWRCEVVGGGPEATALKRQARDNDLESRVHFSGPLPSSRVRDAMCKAQVLVVPSIVGPGGRAEGIPTVLMEAMALGLPVIASRMTGIPELVKHDVNGLLVEPGDERGLAAAITRLSSDKDLGPRLAKAGRQTVERGFDLNDTAARQLVLFDRYSAPGH